MQNPRFGYSGGRYHALLAAEALADRSHLITILSNSLTQVFEDFASLPGHTRINFVVSKRFEYSHYIDKTDIVLIIPSMANDEQLYSQAANCALVNDARLSILNFESPNWFNSLSPVPRDEAHWNLWKKYGEGCSSILCSAEESAKFAKEYYKYDSSLTNIDVCPPSINNFVERPKASPQSDSHRLLVFARFTWSEQKGCTDLRVFLRPELRGCTVVVVTGLASFPEERKEEVLARAEEVGMKIEMHTSLSEIEKVEQIVNASVMLFPSYFEGFGYPPVEALYYKTPCVAFDIPVLREFTSQHTYWAPVGNWDAFVEQIQSALKNGMKKNKLSQYLTSRRFTLAAFGKRLEKVFSKAKALRSNPHLKKLCGIEQ